MTKLTELEEKFILEKILDLEARWFAPRIVGVEDKANFILVSQGRERVGQHWARRYKARNLELSTCFNHVYDYKWALYEDPKLTKIFFRLLENMRAKYGVDDANIYNFDETRFLMGIINLHMVVSHADREWAATIVCINGESVTLPAFFVLQGRVHLPSWYTEIGLPSDWVIKTINSRWKDNNIALELLKHFNQ